MTLEERIQRGLAGQFEGLSNGFQRVNDYIFGIQRGTYYLIGANSGSYKTTCTDYMIINAIQDAKRKQIPLNVFYYSFEIDKLTKQCNWLSQVVYQKHNIIIPPEKIKGLGKFRLTDEEQKIVKDCIPDVEDLFSNINFEFSPVNPTGIYTKLWEFHKSRGVFTYSQYTNGSGETKNKIEKYTPNDSKEMSIVIVDHLYFLKKERDYNTKNTIDKYSEYCVELKNTFGITFINIQQFNRSLSSIERQKFKGVDISPQESDFKETSNTYSDSDVAIGLMCPHKLDLEESLGYNITRFKHPGSILMFKVIKNRLSKDNIAILLYANPKAGNFKELEEPSKINYRDYDNQ